MKIVKLSLRNINSLQGDHEFNFEEICAGGNLFAITGPTGSGKSSILDALTLALYGRTPRYGGNSPSDVMSRHTGECHAEVVFETQQKRYLSKWTLHRAHGKAEGKLQTAHMEVAHAEDGKIIESGLKDTPNVVRDLCGLDFDQFRRSVLLAQGEFAAFLRANSSERSKLLERITGTDVYKDISVYAYEKAKKVRSDWQQLSDRLADINLLGDEQVVELQKRASEIASRVTALETEKSAHSEQLQRREQLEQAEAKLQELQTERRKLEQEQEDVAAALTALDRHQQAAQFAPEVEALDGSIESGSRQEAEVQRLQTQLIAQQEELQQVVESMNRLKTESTQRSEEVAKLHEILPRVRTLDGQIETTESELKSQRVLLDTARDTLTFREGQLEAARQDLAEIKLNEEQNAAWLRENDGDADLAEKIAKIAAAAEAWRSERVNIEYDDDSLKSLRVEIGGAQTEMEQRGMALAADQRNLARAEANIDAADPADLEEEQRELQERESSLSRTADLLRDMAALQEEYARNAAEAARNDERSTKLQNDNARRRAELTSIGKERDTAAEHLRLHAENLARERRIQELEAERERLVQNQPCPLCGSTEHPYVDHYRASQTSELEQAHDEAAQRLRTLEAAVSDLKSELNSAQHQLAESQTRADELQAERSTLTEKFAALPTESSELTRGIAIHEAQRSATALSHVRLRRETNSAALRECRKRLETARERQRELDGLRSAISNHQTALEILQREAQKLDRKREELNLQLEQRGQALRRKRSEAVDLLRPFLPQSDFETPPSEREIEGLQQRDRAYREKLTEQEKLRRDHRAALKNDKLEQERRDDQARITQDKQAETDRLAQQLERLREERLALFGSGDADGKLRELEAALADVNQRFDAAEKSHKEHRDDLQKTTTTLELQTQRLQELKTDIERRGLALRNKIAAAGFASLDELRAAMLDAEQVRALAEKREALRAAFEQNSTLTRDKQTELDQRRQDAPTPEDAARITSELDELAKTLDELKQETGAINEKLRRNGEQSAHFSDLKVQLQDKQKEKTRWETISELIGSSSGDKFSRFAQSLTLQRLVALANRHIVRLNDRYRIRKQPTDEARSGADLELEIVDRHQADTIRPMQSLSGGESFLVSLGLALGLAELAGRSNRIDSLFIDEGFGSLDATTLDSALNVLETLQAQGKTIGVISHVETLKERIATQIQVLKLSGGISATRVLTPLGAQNLPISA